MRQERSTASTDWTCIEFIAQRIYSDEYVLLTRGDIEEIEETIENGDSFDDEDEGGDMDFPLATTITIVGIGMSAIQTLIGYLSWKYPKVQPSQINEGTPNISRDFVSMFLEDDKDYNLVTKEEIRAELLKKRAAINNILNRMYPEDL